jgi:hypothetical protein
MKTNDSFDEKDGNPTCTETYQILTVLELSLTSVLVVTTIIFRCTMK